MKKRGFLQTIFGKLRDLTGQSFASYRLLSNWDSHFSPFSGNAWDISTVRAAVDAFARNAAKVLPRHIRRTHDNKREDITDSINRIIQFRPNPYMTAYAFYYRVSTQYLMDNNAFIFPVWDNGNLAALYPINAHTVELVERNGDMYARLVFRTGSAWVCPYEDLIHLRRHFKGNDIFGDANKPLIPVLDTAHAFNQSMTAFAKLVAVIRGVLKVKTGTKDADLNAQRDKFIANNLNLDNNGSGLVVTDSKYDYEPITTKDSTAVPDGQLKYIRQEIYDYFGVNEEIVQNKADAKMMDSFYSGSLSPFYMQLAQGLTNGLFTDRERSFGHEILCELNRLEFETLHNRTEAAKFLSSVGAATLDQLLDIFGLPPIGGEEGSRRVQTLNMSNVEIVDEHQLANSGITKPKKDDEDDEDEGKQEDESSNEDEDESKPKTGRKILCLKAEQ